MLKPGLVPGLVSLTLLLSACGGAPREAALTQNTDVEADSVVDRAVGALAPVLGTDNPHLLAGQYIVVMSDPVKDGAQSGALQAQGTSGLIAALHLNPQGVQVRYRYGQTVNGFAAQLSEENLQTLRRDPHVKYIEQDALLNVNDTEAGATWGLDRIDQGPLPLDSTYTYATTAAGVTAYIFDTGIRTTHTQFGGRAVWGTNQTGDGNNTDCHGHGTHVAGTVGGSIHGVAKNVRLVAVKVLDCAGSGTTSGVIAGINWATANMSGPSVGNMSLGGATSQSLDDAVKAAVSKGMVMVAAAGNDNVDACTQSPARVASALTVGATVSSDARASYSNYGSCVDLFAPGSSIVSTAYTSDTDTTVKSGTSMATPHVTGAAALILGENPTYTPAQVASVLIARATTGTVTGAGLGSPNLLLYTGGSSVVQPPAADPPPPPPPSDILPPTYTGTLGATGDSSLQPGAAGFSYAGGTLKGTLSGPAGTDFDLYLQKLGSNGRWRNVASDVGTGSSEAVSYAAAAGTYRWRVYSYSGAGDFTLTETK